MGIGKIRGGNVSCLYTWDLFVKAKSPANIQNEWTHESIIFGREEIWQTRSFLTNPNETSFCVFFLFLINFFLMLRRVCEFFRCLLVYFNSIYFVCKSWVYYSVFRKAKRDRCSVENEKIYLPTFCCRCSNISLKLSDGAWMARLSRASEAKICTIFMHFKRVCQLIGHFQDDANVIKQMMHGFRFVCKFFFRCHLHISFLFSCTGIYLRKWWQ